MWPWLDHVPISTSTLEEPANLRAFSGRLLIETTHKDKVLFYKASGDFLASKARTKAVYGGCTPPLCSSNLWVYPGEGQDVNK